MNVEAVLKQARELGVSLTAEGEHILYRPKSVAPPDFVEALRQLKGELLLHLRYRQKYPDGPPGDQELWEIEERVCSEGYCLLWSNVLEDFVAFYRDEHDKARIPPGFVPYTDAELHLLFGEGDAAPSPNGLRLIHEAKKLGGRIIDHWTEGGGNGDA